MAGPTVKEILVKWGIDTSSWKTAIQQLGKLLDDQNKKSAAANADAAKAFASQVDSAEELLTIVKKDTAEIQKQSTLVGTLSVQHEALVDLGWDQVAIEKAITAEIQKQILLRKGSGVETVRSGKLAGGVTGKATKVAFDQQAVIASSIKAVIVELQAEVTKFLGVEKLVTKELQKQQNVINSIRRAPAVGTVAVQRVAVPRVLPPLKQPVLASPYAIAVANLNAAKAKGGLSEEKEREAHAKIVVLLDQEIAKKKLSAASTAQEVAQMEKLVRLRSTQAAQSKGEETGLGKTLQEFGAGTISRMMGTLGFAVFSAEGIGRIFESATEKLKEFIKEVGPLQQVREQFEKLASSQGLQPTKFIDDMREATKGLVSDTVLFRSANTFLQSGIRVSQEDIVKLTEATVGLARAQGKDATEAVQALNQFFLTGYARTLSHVVGMQAQQISSLRGMGREFGGVAASTMAFRQALEAITKQYAAIATGTPAQTYVEALTKLRNAQNRVLEEFVLGLEQSRGFKSIIAGVDELADKLGGLAEKAAAFGDVVGNALAQIYQAINFLLSGVVEIGKDLFGILVADIKNIAATFGLGGTQADEFTSRLTTLQGIAATLGETITILVGGVRELVTWLRFAAEAAPDLERGLVESIPIVGRITSYFDKLSSKDGLSSLDKVKHALNAAFSREAQIAEDVDKSLSKAEDIRTGKDKKPYALSFGVPTFRVTEEQQIESEKKIAKVKEEIALQVAKTQLEHAQNRIKREEELNQILYEESLRSFSDYIAAKKALEDDDYNARKRNIEDELRIKQNYQEKDTALQRAEAALQKAQVEQGYAADKKALNDKVIEQRDRLREDAKQGKIKLPEIDKAVTDIQAQYTVQSELIENNRKAGLQVAAAMTAEIDAKSTLNQAEANTKREALETEHQGKTFRINQEATDKIKAVKESASRALLSIDKGQIAQSKALVEIEFKEGLTSANEYLNARKELVEKEYRAEIAAADNEFKFAKDKVLAKQTQDNQYLAAAQEREKAYTELQQHELDIRVGAAEAASNRIKSVLEAQLAQQQDLGKINPFQTRAGEITTINSLIAADRQRLEVLRQQVELQKDEPEAQAKTRVEIEKTEQSLHGYRDKLIEISDMSKDIASEARNMATAAGLFPKGSKTAQGLEKYAQITETIGKLNQDFLKSVEAGRGVSRRPLTPEEVYEALKKSSDIAGDSLRQLAEDAKDKVDSAVATVHDSLVNGFAVAVDATTKALYFLRDAAVAAAKPEKEPSAIGSDYGRNLVENLFAPKAEESAAKPPTSGTNVGALPGFQAGGHVSITGPALVHAGEYVLPTSMAAVFNSFIKALGDFVKFLEPKISAVKPTAGATPIRGTAPIAEASSQPNFIKEFLLALENFGRVLVGKKPIVPKPIEARIGTRPLGKAPVKTVGKVPVSTIGKAPIKTVATATPAKAKPDTSALELNIKSLTDAINKLTQQITQITQPSQPAGPSGPAPKAPDATPLYPFSSGGGSEGVSGLPTPQSPQGVLTDSDKQSLNANLNANVTSGLGNAQGASDSLMSLASSAQSASDKLSGLADSSQQAQTSKDAGAGGDGGGDSGDSGGIKGQMSVLSKGISSVMGMVGGVMQTFHTTGAFQGAMAGAASFGQIGAMAGPIGAAVGAVVGGIAGAISGSMRAATERMAERMSAAFQAIVQEVQTGNQTLGAGISLSIQQIQTTVSSLSGRKGGRDDLKQILPNMEQELAQLQQQQKQVLQAMDQQVSALNAPLAYQAQLQSVNQIVTAYQQYIQAGGNVVTANQYLQDSFKNLETQGMQQLNQDEQDAVNNALNYNNLLLQRQTLIQDTNQQIQDIMSQGVAVRQMPEGVTKARQIQALMLNSSQQLDQLNQQISVSQYQLNVQQQIFGLATTRIGLENQLVILQNEQTNYSMQQIAALGNILGQFQTKLPTSMQAALQQLGLGAAFVNPGTEPGLKPVPPVKTGISQIDLQNQLQYQQALAAWQLSQNFPIGYIPTSGNVSTTNVPTTIGNPTVYGPNSGLNSTWLTPGTTSILGTATSAATSLNTLGNAFGTLPSTVAGTVAGSLGIPSTLPSVPSLTINGTQVDTVSTPAGQALLVTTSGLLGGETPTTTVTGPGTTQQIGIVGTAGMAAAATNSIFGALAGFPATATPAPAPGTTTTTATPTSPIRFPTAATSTVNEVQQPTVTTSTPVPPVKTGISQIDLQNQLQYQQALAATTSTTAPAAPVPAGGAPATAINSAFQLITPGAVSGLLPGTGMGASIAAAFNAAMKITPASIAAAIFGKNPVPGGAPATAVNLAPAALPAATPATIAPGGQTAVPLAVQTAITSQQQAANTLVTTSLQRVSAETQISQLSNSRIAAESALVSMKMTEIQADMQRVQAHNDLLTRSTRVGNTSVSLESLFQNLYEERGRQGFGSFYGETSNPT